MGFPKIKSAALISEMRLDLVLSTCVQKQKQQIVEPDGKAPLLIP